MKNWVKKLVKEIKRIRWISGKEANSTFWKSLIFIMISALVLFLMTTGLVALWNAIGVGVN